jgi:hypothetical protein
MMPFKRGLIVLAIATLGFSSIDQPSAEARYRGYGQSRVSRSSRGFNISRRYPTYRVSQRQTRLETAYQPVSYNPGDRPKINWDDQPRRSQIALAAAPTQQTASAPKRTMPKPGNELLPRGVSREQAQKMLAEHPGSYIQLAEKFGHPNAWRDGTAVWNINGTGETVNGVEITPPDRVIAIPNGSVWTNSQRISAKPK